MSKHTKTPERETEETPTSSTSPIQSRAAIIHQQPQPPFRNLTVVAKRLLMEGNLAEAMRLLSL